MSRNIRIATAAVALTMIAAGLLERARDDRCPRRHRDRGSRREQGRRRVRAGRGDGDRGRRGADGRGQHRAQARRARADDGQERHRARPRHGPPGDPAITWEAPNAQGSGGPVHGTVSIARQGALADGRPCREYVQTVNIGGEEAQARGTACRDAYGECVIVDG